MDRSKTFALATVPAAAGFAWRGYRKAARAVAAYPPLEPDLPGERRQVETRWGSAAYRFIKGDESRPALVFIHGWGKTGDSAWWPIMAECDRTMVIVDLPGHGYSKLDAPFTFAIAAEAVERSVVDAGVISPIVVAHSMGGPVAFSAIRRGDPRLFSGLIVLATSAYWVRPRLRAMMTMAPIAMAPRSPFLIHTQLIELNHSPELAPHIVWSYARRPNPRVLGESAAALRGFDARHWTDLSLPPTRWVVSTQDSVLAPRHQHESARRFGGEVVELEAQHSMVVQAPKELLSIIEDFGSE